MRATKTRQVVRTRDGVAIVIERNGDAVMVSIYPRGLDQYAGDTVALTWRETGVFAAHLLNTADQQRPTGAS